MKDIEVVADGTGAPFLVHHTGGSTSRLPHAVSLSHTPHAAVAVVVKVHVPKRLCSRPLCYRPWPCPSPAPSRRRGSLPADPAGPRRTRGGDRCTRANVLDREMTLLIVIVNYRTTELTLDCLRSLQDEVGTVAGTRVVVTDNASGDDSVDAPRCGGGAPAAGASWATIQPLEQNGGFAAGNNAAIRPALASADPPTYVLLLNPDTIVRPGALRTLVEFMENRPDVGIAGSRLEEPDGTPQRSAFRFPSVLGELEGGLRLGRSRGSWRAGWSPQPCPTEPGPTDWVAGACMIIRREVFDGDRPAGRRLLHVFRGGGLLPPGPPRRLALLVRPRSPRGAPGRAELRRDRPSAQRGGAGQATGSRRGGVTSSATTGASRRCWPTSPGRSATPRIGSGGSSSASPTPTHSGCSGTSSGSIFCWYDDDPDPWSPSQISGPGRRSNDPL